MEDEKCQCCLKNFIYENINSEHLVGQNNIYSELIKETFNISISLEISQICNECLTKLNEASEFKRMILKTQDELKNVFHDLQETQLINDIKTGESLKTDNLLWDIDKDSTISSTDSIQQMQIVIDDKEYIIENSTRELKRKAIKIKDKVPVLPPENRSKIKSIREDSMKLLKYSNMCLFKTLKSKFQCYTCKETFINMSDLRSHTKLLSNPKDRGLKVNLRGYCSKNADISSLTCNLCHQTCNDLKLLKQHLETKHSIQFNSNDHMFVPYKLVNGFQCVTCGEKFNSFIGLTTHMNRHSTNNVCEICGLFFINRLRLRRHLQSVHREKKCSLCTARFEKSSAKIKHMWTVHNIGSQKRYCSTCGKDFRHSYLLLGHKIKEHGFKRQKSSCTDCGKTFLSLQNLKIHIRSVHVKERNFPCNICGMRFFTKADEKRHQKKHDDVKLFSCSYCEGKFKSKDSWKRHLKRIHDKLIE